MCLLGVGESAQAVALQGVARIGCGRYGGRSAGVASVLLLESVARAFSPPCGVALTVAAVASAGTAPFGLRLSNRIFRRVGAARRAAGRRRGQMGRPDGDAAGQSLGLWLLPSPRLRTRWWACQRGKEKTRLFVQFFRFLFLSRTRGGIGSAPWHYRCTTHLIHAVPTFSVFPQVRRR